MQLPRPPRGSISAGIFLATSVASSFFLQADSPPFSLKVLAQSATNWTFCARENQNCQFSGTRQVRYGANGKYVTQTHTNGVYCGNSVFGDPVPTVGKNCELASSASPSPTPAPTPAPQSTTTSWTFCARENQNCQFSGTRQVRYGANGKYVTQTHTNGVYCGNSVFGDPVPTVGKNCELASSASPSPTPAPTPAPQSTTTSWTFCARENQNCQFSGTRQVRYGANGKYVTQTHTNGVYCGNSVFGDPVPTVGKNCELASTTASAVSAASTPTPTPTPSSTPTPTPTPTPTSNLTPPQTPGFKAFPANIGWTNVKDFGARGDGATDDTAAIKAALAANRAGYQDYYMRPKTLYFPAGTYLVNDTLGWVGCCVTLQGQGVGQSILRLRDNASGYGNANSPKAVIKTDGGNMSFRQNIMDLTVSVGRGNPGAVGIDYVANNNAVIRNVEIKSEDGQGVSGLDMVREWPGPSLTKDLIVSGFNYGIRLAQDPYGPTFENITLRGQRVAGIRNDGNLPVFRRVFSNNSVPAIQNVNGRGMMTIVDSELSGGNGGQAIQNSGYLYARNVRTSGYAAAASGVSGTSITEYVSGQIQSVFPSPQRSLGLPVKETPEFHDNELSNWASVSRDLSNLQAALNSGKSTVYFPFIPDGGYAPNGTLVVNVPASVRRIYGAGTVVGGVGNSSITFRVAEASSTPLVIEHFGSGATVEQAANRPVVMKDGFMSYKDSTGGAELYIENVEFNGVDFSSYSSKPFNMNGKSVWCRQCNLESLNGAQTKLINNGSTVWMLGLKTEGRGTLIQTQGRGQTEVLGAYVFPVSHVSTNNNDPAFVVGEGSAFSGIWGVNTWNGNFGVQVRETRDGVTRDFTSSQAGERIPLFTGFR